MEQRVLFMKKMEEKRENGAFIAHKIDIATNEKSGRDGWGSVRDSSSRDSLVVRIKGETECKDWALSASENIIKTSEPSAQDGGRIRKGARHGATTSLSTPFVRRFKIGSATVSRVIEIPCSSRMGSCVLRMKQGARMGGVWRRGAEYPYRRLSLPLNSGIYDGCSYAMIIKYIVKFYGFIETLPYLRRQFHGSGKILGIFKFVDIDIVRRSYSWRLDALFGWNSDIG